MLKAAQSHYDSYEAAVEAYMEKGWTDGLPIVPPTPDKVERFLAAAGLAPGAVLGTVPTREVTVTAEQAAINAVMAGCKPEYMPVVVAAARALLEEKANLHSTTGTLTGAAHAVIVNGPIRTELGIACKSGCFGPGFRPNATIGRALRLMVRNVAKGIPGYLDRASFSTPMRYSFCFGENEEDSPWKPLHVERGLRPDESAVTVASIMYMTSCPDSGSRTPEGILNSLAKRVRQTGVIGDKWLGDDVNVVLIMGTEHMRYFAEAGWSKQQMRDYIFPKLIAEPREGPMYIKRPECILFVAAGGPGMAETWILHPHLGLAVTKRIEVAVVS